MRIWWAYRAGMEGFLFFSLSFYFMGGKKIYLLFKIILIP
jgi:hypothetical protein